MKIVALISTYQEEDLLPSVLRSSQDLDLRLVFDGPVGAEIDTWNNGDYGLGDIVFFEGEWISDASKRTSMLDIARVLTDGKEDVWVLWLDGDEILIWGEYLHDHCRRADEETATGGTAIKIVEYDGSVANCFGKLIKTTTVQRYVMSSYEVELVNGMTVALPNVPICTAGGIPIINPDEGIPERDNPVFALNRPPLQGEPHLLHRHGLRNPERRVERLHDAEAESFQTLVKDAGLEGVDKTAGSTAMLTDPLEEEDR